jgi:hypothetical protein
MNMVIWEYRHSTDLSEEYLVKLHHGIMDCSQDSHISSDALIQLLVTVGNKRALWENERPWFIGRMLKVAKRLTRPSFECLNGLLIVFLTLNPCLELVMGEWSTISGQK